MGFSVGGKVTYSYGLANTHRLSGFIPIGAAINGTSGVESVLENSTAMPFYLVHGELDNPSTRFFPMQASLIGYSAIVEDTLMPGIGHTIDFPDRNAILSRAYQWVDSVNSANIPSGILKPISTQPIKIYPNPATSEINFALPEEEAFEVEIFDTNGKLLIRRKNCFRLPVSTLSSGTYVLQIHQGHTYYSQYFIKH
jgi:hypothetical protein